MAVTAVDASRTKPSLREALAEAIAAAVRAGDLVAVDALLVVVRRSMTKHE